MENTFMINEQSKIVKKKSKKKKRSLNVEKTQDDLKGDDKYRGTEMVTFDSDIRLHQITELRTEIDDNINLCCNAKKKHKKFKKKYFVKDELPDFVSGNSFSTNHRQLERTEEMNFSNDNGSSMKNVDDVLPKTKTHKKKKKLKRRHEDLNSSDTIATKKHKSDTDDEKLFKENSRKHKKKKKRKRKCESDSDATPQESQSFGVSCSDIELLCNSSVSDSVHCDTPKHNQSSDNKKNNNSKTNKSFVKDVTLTYKSACSPVKNFDRHFLNKSATVKIKQIDLSSSRTSNEIEVLHSTPNPAHITHRKSQPLKKKKRKKDMSNHTNDDNSGNDETSGLFEQSTDVYNFVSDTESVSRVTSGNAVSADASAAGLSGTEENSASLSDHIDTNLFNLSTEQMADVLHQGGDVSSLKKSDVETQLKDHIKKGRWTVVEEEQLRSNWDAYFQAHPHPEPYLFLTTTTIPDAKLRNEIRSLKETTNFWMCVGKNILRPTYSVYKRCRALFTMHKERRNEKYSSEEDALLLELYDKHKHKTNKWQLIGGEMERSSQSVNDRYKKLTTKPSKTDEPCPKWTEEEDEQLIAGLMTVNEGEVTGTCEGTKWKAVASLVNNRNGDQCRERWIKVLSRPVLTEENRRYKLQAADQVHLIHCVSSQKVDLEVDVNWNTVSESFNKYLTPSLLRHYWHSMKSHYVKGHKTMSHREIVRSMTAVIPVLEDREAQQMDRGHSSIVKSSEHYTVTVYTHRDQPPRQVSVNTNIAFSSSDSSLSD